MVVLDERGDINAAGIAIYIILSIFLGIVYRRNKFRGMLGLYYVCLFTFGKQFHDETIRDLQHAQPWVLVKTIGGSMTVYVQSTLDMRLYTPAAIIGTVVLSPLMLAVCALLMPEYV